MFQRLNGILLWVLGVDRHEQEHLAGIPWDTISHVECKVSKLKLSF